MNQGFASCLSNSLFYCTTTSKVFFSHYRAALSYSLFWLTDIISFNDVIHSCFSISIFGFLHDFVFETMPEATEGLGFNLYFLKSIIWFLTQFIHYNLIQLLPFTQEVSSSDHRSKAIWTLSMNHSQITIISNEPEIDWYWYMILVMATSLLHLTNLVNYITSPIHFLGILANWFLSKINYLPYHQVRCWKCSY